MTDYIRSLREKIGHDTILIPSADAIIVNAAGEILLQERAGQGTWGCPGGTMELGESVLENVAREVLEETGLRINNPTLFGIYSGRRYHGVYPNGDKIQSVSIVFLVHDFEGELRVDSESKSLRFFPLSELPDRLGKHHEEYIADYVEYAKGNRTIPIVR